MFASIRFLWNATRGHRLQPWKSEYLRWRIETYSGLHAEEVTGRVFLRFIIRERYRLIHFLLWTARVDRATRA
jgi:hypothetical protein